MAKAVQEIGVFERDGVSYRWLAIAADSIEELGRLRAEAKVKEWRELPFFEGEDPARGWPAVWMEKPVA